MLPSLDEMLTRLIATPSVSSVNSAFDTSNEAVCTLIADWLETLGFAVEMQAVPGEPGKFNVLAVRGEGPGGLVLSGHTDTVPYDEGRWSVDPFGAMRRDGRLYGLGSADMKSFLALAIETARRCADVALRRPLIILATADEESTMSGARALAAAGRPAARYAVIGEPTGLRPVNAHKGVMMEGLRLRGRSGHSSNPALGNNAIDGMHRAIGELMAYRRELAQSWHDESFAVPVPTLNLGFVRGGDNANRICGECELHFDMRLLPGMSPDAIRTQLRERVANALADSGLELTFEALMAGLAALRTPADSALLAACEQLTGHGAATVDFATEGPFLAELGMDTIVMGPGDIAQAHQPDEYISLSALDPTIALLGQLVQRFCVAPGA